MNSHQPNPTHQPTSSQPTSSQPTSSQPTGSQPTSSQPTSSQPTSSQPAGHQPTGNHSEVALSSEQIQAFCMEEEQALSIWQQRPGQARRAVRLRAHAALLSPLYRGELPARLPQGPERVWRLQHPDGRGPWKAAEDAGVLFDWIALMPVQDILGAPHHSGQPLRHGETELVTGAPNYALLEDWFVPVWESVQDLGLIVCEYQAWAPECTPGPLQTTFSAGDARLLSSFPPGTLRRGAGFSAFEVQAAGMKPEVKIKFAWEDALIRSLPEDALRALGLSDTQVDHVRGPI